MAHTITEKIFLSHTEKKDIKPGEFIYANVDLALGNDITAPLAIEEFQRLGLDSVFDRNKVVLVPDHFAPNKDQKAANQCKILENFSRDYRIKNYFKIGRMGIEHALLPQEGLVRPGDLVIGADSHTCTYGALGAFATGVGSTDLAAVMAAGKCWFKAPQTIKFVYTGKLKKWVGGKDLILFTIADIGVDGSRYMSMEFTGPAIRNLSMDDRFAMCNMAIEAGAKNGIVEPDEATYEYLKPLTPTLSPKGRGKGEGVRKYNQLKSDRDAKYFKVKEYDASKIDLQVAAPHLPSNSRQVSRYKDIKIDQSVIGSCTNGRISDLRVAAKILKSRKVHKDVRLIVVPATQKIYLDAVKEGLARIFIEAGGVFTTPTCGPCIGGHSGVLAAGERAIATTNRNFRGRMGHLDSEVYLSGPAVAAASAVLGRIAHPEEI
jgi:3-isopropylmalate/(R)-2-methylmalate dehydratase large subunit